MHLSCLMPPCIQLELRTSILAPASEAGGSSALSKALNALLVSTKHYPGPIFRLLAWSLAELLTIQQLMLTVDVIRRVLARQS